MFIKIDYRTLNRSDVNPTRSARQGADGWVLESNARLPSPLAGRPERNACG